MKINPSGHEKSTVEAEQIRRDVVIQSFESRVEHYAQLVLDKSRRRQARAAGQCLINATDDLSVPTGDCIERVQESLLEIEAASGRVAARHMKEFMPEVLRELETQSQNQGLVGMTTGIPSLDLAAGGICPGQLWTIGAVPGKGKTALIALLKSGNREVVRGIDQTLPRGSRLTPSGFIENKLRVMLNSTLE